MMADKNRDIDAAIAAEEHHQGRPYLDDPDHCARCAEVDQAWAIATCPHEDYAEIVALDNHGTSRICYRCGELIEIAP